ncbi:MAG: prepilin-type N-terminal cleavage/methylation domain-containing protein [Parcubacteria group bacterium]
MINKLKNRKGFSLVELVVGVTVFTIICISAYNAYVSIFDVVYLSRAKLNAVDLTNEQLEIVRNLPYADVGVVGGIPNGKIPHNQTLVRGGSTFNITSTIRNVDDPFDGTISGTPRDLSPGDFKIVEVEVDCPACKNFEPITVTTRVAPENLETASTNGALFVRVFDANGNPIPDARVYVVNNQVIPNIVIDDVTNTDGMLQIVDAPPGINAYNITVSKTGYSTDRTESPTIANPNPTKPPATVTIQNVTQLSFAIDRTSTFNVSSVTQTCSPIANVDFSLIGTKLKGTSPDVLKYNQNLVTSGSGLLSLTGMEWDSYIFNLIDDAYDLVGISPVSPINLIPNSNQAIQLVVAPKNPRTLVLFVTDGATSLPLSDVEVTLSKSSFTSVIKNSGTGFINQTDWSSGSGQATSTDSAKYFSSDGNIEIANPAGDLVLGKIFDEYVSSGILESSAFDIGSTANFQKIQWNPIDQPVSVGVPNVRIQLATNSNGGAWNFLGPDGTSGSYYTTNNQNINAINNNNRYLRYRVFLDSVSTTSTPNVSNISFTFTSLCTPPGQVFFDGLPSGTYNLHLTKTGYTDQDVSVQINSEWQSQSVVMLPS